MGTDHHQLVRYNVEHNVGGLQDMHSMHRCGRPHSVPIHTGRMQITSPTALQFQVWFQQPEWYSFAQLQHIH